MDRLRRYGEPPFKVAVVHGGPGAGGEMAPVARELSRDRGVLEPIQTATSLDGQVDELRDHLETYGVPPFVLIGFSWGAWLSFILAARHQPLVRKLILVSSGPFEQAYVAKLHETRMSRLTKEERQAFEAVLMALEEPESEAGDAALARLGTLARKADAFDPLYGSFPETDLVGPRADVFQSVWREGAELRRTGGLLELARQIKCPVVAIHGDYDPHPPEGVRDPLREVLDQFQFILLQRCGHKPWVERQARYSFFRVLKREAG